MRYLRLVIVYHEGVDDCKFRLKPSDDIYILQTECIHCVSLFECDQAFEIIYTNIPLQKMFCILKKLSTTAYGEVVLSVRVQVGPIPM